MNQALLTSHILLTVAKTFALDVVIEAIDAIEASIEVIELRLL